MTRRGLIILSAFTALAVALAVWLSNGGLGEGDPQEAGQPLFPGLGERLAEAQSISLSGPEGTASLTFRAGRWEVGERDGYTADHAQVRRLLAGLVRATRLEPKTADPVRLDQIGLGDDAVTLTVTGAEGSELAALKIGNALEPASDDQRKTFVWAGGEARSWLVSALPAVTTSPILWLNKEIIALSNARISGVAITRSDGDNLTLTGQANNIPGLRVEGQTADENLVGGPANQTMTALAKLGFDDVAGEGEIIGTVIATAIYQTFDGLVVEVEILAAEAGGSWARLGASYDAGVALSDESPSLMTDAPADGAAEAEELNTRWAGWIYSLAEFDVEALTRPRSTVIIAAQSDE